MFRFPLYSFACTAGLLVACSADHPLGVSQSTDVKTPADAATSPLPPADAGTDVVVAPVVEDAGADAGACLGDSPMFEAKCPTSGTCGEGCAHVAQNYRAGVASYVADCLAKLTTCDEYDLRNCVDQAAARSCSSATAPEYCTGFVKRCDPNAGGDGSAITQSGCVMYARALTAAGREQFQACFEASIEAGTCAPAGSISCADQIRQ